MEEEGSDEGATEETGGAEEEGSNEEEGSALEEGVSLLREEQAVIEKTKASVIKVQINAFIVNFLSNRLRKAIAKQRPPEKAVGFLDVDGLRLMK